MFTKSQHYWRDPYIENHLTNTNCSQVGRRRNKRNRRQEQQQQRFKTLYPAAVVGAVAEAVR